MSRRGSNEYSFRRNTQIRARAAVRPWRAALNRMFVPRQILLRIDGRMRCLTLGRHSQMAAAAAALALLGWVAVTSASYFRYDNLIAGKDREIGALKHAYAGLESDLAKTEGRFKTIARTLEAKHAYLMAVLERDWPAVDASGGSDDGARQRIESSRRALLAQLGALELVLKGDAREGQHPKSTTSPETRASERLISERRRLLARIETLEARLLDLNRSQRGLMAFMAEQTVDEFFKVKRLIADTGLDVDRMLASIGGQAGQGGQGGPFIAAGGDDDSVRPTVKASIGTIDHQLDRWDELRRLIGRLPLAAPSDHFYVASGFGKRRDPVNGRWAMHHGVDLAGVYRSPVRATAPGVVTRAGWNGTYGRMVEIDHGMGIRTRYGHLRRITVRRGEKVGYRQQIGQMGSSGRSTGTHVHYEILVHGKPYDPQKFLKAGDYVLKGY